MLTFGIGNLIGISVGASLFWQLGGPGLRRISTPDSHDAGSLLYQRLGALSFAAPLASAALNLCACVRCAPERRRVPSRQLMCEQVLARAVHAGDG